MKVNTGPDCNYIINQIKKSENNKTTDEGDQSK